MNPKTLARIKNRMPKIERKPSLSQQFPLTPEQEGFPDIGLDIGKVAQAASRRIYLKISEQQWENLNKPIVHPATGITYASPVEMRAMHPKAWSTFIDHLHEMPVFKHINMTTGTIISAICGYHYLGGWLDYLPEVRVNQEYSLEELGL